jgi:hypothetical protein
MCNQEYIDFTNDAPIEFKKSFKNLSFCYVFSVHISNYAWKIGYVLSTGIISLQQILDKYDTNHELNDDLILSVLIIIWVMGIISTIVGYVAIVKQKNVDDILVKYTHYFNQLPILEEEMEESRLKPNPNVIAALKFKYHVR